MLINSIYFEGWIQLFQKKKETKQKYLFKIQGVEAFIHSLYELLTGFVVDHFISLFPVFVPLISCLGRPCSLRYVPCLSKTHQVLENGPSSITNILPLILI